MHLSLQVWRLMILDEPEAGMGPRTRHQAMKVLGARALNTRVRVKYRGAR